MFQPELFTAVVQAMRRRRILSVSQPGGEHQNKRLPPVTLRVVLRSLQVFSWFAAYLVIFVVVLGPFLWLAAAIWDRDRR